MNVATRLHVGIVGTGEMGGCNIELAVEACRLAASVGIDEATLARTLHTGSGQSYSLDLVAALGSAKQLLGSAGYFVHKDVAVASDVAAEIGVSLGTFAGPVTPVLQRTRPTTGMEGP